MQCPACKFVNRPGVRYCTECGADLTAAPKGAVAAAKPSGSPAAPAAPPDRVVCPSCNNTNNKNATHCGYCSRLLPMLPGTITGGRYRIESIIGQGGMGRVYMASDTKAVNIQAAQRFAVKELLDDAGWTAKERDIYVSLFKREANLLGRLGQLRTVPELAVPYYEENSRSLFIMEFVPGRNLEEELKQRGSPFPVDTVVEWGIELCSLLHSLHHNTEGTIVHQDIKPENIILRKDRPRAQIAMLDFGLARKVREGNKISRFGGTEGYAAKEQLQGRPETRSDLYSLAATMHHLLTNRDPRDFPGVPMPSVRSLNPQVPQWLDELIAINLNEEPQERYDSVAALKEDLEKRQVTQLLSCPGCNTLNERRLIYCKKCARTLLSRSRSCDTCSGFMPANALFCPNCGAKVA